MITKGERGNWKRIKKNKEIKRRRDSSSEGKRRKKTN
jgi:hypothetical protein